MAQVKNSGDLRKVFEGIWLRVEEISSEDVITDRVQVILFSGCSPIESHTGAAQRRLLDLTFP